MCQIVDAPHYISKTVEKGESVISTLATTTHTLKSTQTHTDIHVQVHVPYFLE